MDRKLRHAKAVFPPRDSRRTTVLRRARPHESGADITQELEAEGKRLDALRSEVDRLLVIAVGKFGLTASVRRTLSARQRTLLRKAGLL